jgi:DNA-directed RNA polymerase specialized sigma24 family protein
LVILIIFALNFSKRMVSRNQLIDLLETDFLTRTVQKTVQRYVNRRAIPVRERQDVEMAVIEEFIKQKNQIVSTFQGKSQASTYCTAVINRMCCAVIRKEYRHWRVTDHDLPQGMPEAYSVSDDRTDHRLLIKLELSRLQNAFEHFRPVAPAMEVLLTLYFELRPQTNSFVAWAGFSDQQMDKWLVRIKNHSKTDRYRTIAALVSAVENRALKPDALRMRIYKYMDLLIEFLNQNDQSGHNRETLKLLFELRDTAQTETPDVGTQKRNRLFFLTLIPLMMLL